MPSAEEFLDAAPAPSAEEFLDIPSNAETENTAEARKTLAEYKAGKIDLDQDQVESLGQIASSGEGPWDNLWSGIKGAMSVTPGDVIDLGVKAATEVGKAGQRALTAYASPQSTESEKFLPNAVYGAGRGLTSLIPATTNLATGLINLTDPDPENVRTRNAAAAFIEHSVSKGNEDLRQTLGAEEESPEASVMEFIPQAAIPIGIGSKTAPLIAKTADAIVEKGTQVAGKTIQATAKAGAASAPAAIAAVEAASGAPWWIPLATIVAGYGGDGIPMIRKLKHAIIDKTFDKMGDVGKILANAPEGRTIIESMQDAARTEASRLRAQIDDISKTNPGKVSDAYKKSPDGSPLYTEEELSGAAKKIRQAEDKISSMGEREASLGRYASLNKILSDGAKFGVRTTLNLAESGAVGAALVAPSAGPGDAGEAAKQGMAMGVGLGALGAYHTGSRQKLGLVREKLLEGSTLDESHPSFKNHQTNIEAMPPRSKDYVNSFSALAKKSAGKPIAVLTPEQMVEALKNEGTEVARAPNGFDGKDTIYVNSEALASGVVPHEVIHGTGLDAHPEIVKAIQEMQSDPALKTQLQAGIDKYNSDLQNNLPGAKLSADSTPKEIAAALGADMLTSLPPEAIFGGRSGGQIISKWIKDKFGSKENSTTGQYGFPVTPKMKSAMENALFDLGEAASKPKATEPTTAKIEKSEPLPDAPTPEMATAAAAIEAMGFKAKEAMEMAKAAHDELKTDDVSSIVSKALAKKANPIPLDEEAPKPKITNQTLADIHLGIEKGEIKSDQYILNKLGKTDVGEVSLMPSESVSKSDQKTGFWHGSPSQDLRGGAYGLHVGTFRSAQEALHARIGKPMEGEWDGTREYGKTLLSNGEYPKPATYHAPVRQQDGTWKDGPAMTWEEAQGKVYNPRGAVYSGGFPVEMDSKPNIFPVKIKGKMRNSPLNPIDDESANSRMIRQKKRGAVSTGNYYKNDAEDFGSVSAVVPTGEHLSYMPGKNPTLPKDALVSEGDLEQLRKSNLERLGPTESDAAKRVGGATGAAIEEIMRRNAPAPRFMPSEHPNALSVPAIRRKSDGKVYEAPSRAWTHHAMESTHPDLADMNTLGGYSKYEWGWADKNHEFLDKDQAHARAIETKQLDKNAKVEYKGALSSADMRTFGKFMPAGKTSLNIGLNTNEGGKIAPEQALASLKAKGVDVTKFSVVQSGTEPTLVVDTSRKLSPEEMNQLAIDLKQDAIPQYSDGEGVMHGPGKDKWGDFNGEYFLDHEGKPISAQKEPVIGDSAMPEAPPSSQKLSGVSLERLDRSDPATGPIIDEGAKPYEQRFQELIHKEGTNVDNSPLTPKETKELNDLTFKVFKDYGSVEAFEKKYPAQSSGKTAQLMPSPNKLGFYSKLESVIDEKMGNRASVDQIKGLIKSGGVKADELKWSGTDDWLSSQEKLGLPVTKKELLDHIRENNVQIEEVVKGGIPDSAGYKDLKKRYLEKQAEYYKLNDTPVRDQPGHADQMRLVSNDMRLLSNQMNRISGSQEVKFKDHVLPGGDEGSYREVLLTLPKKPADSTGWTASEGKGDLASGPVWEVRDKSGRWILGVPKETAKTSAEAISYVASRDSDRARLPGFRSSHFEEPNIIAHVRYDTRTTPEGKNLHIAEVQSDAFQLQRKNDIHNSSVVEKNFDTILEKMKKDGILEIICT